MDALRWLSEPPPWPPASVEKLQNRGGDRAIAMVHDLAGQIAPDPALRFWLVQSWLRPRRLFDQALLAELRGPKGAGWFASRGSAPGCGGNGQPGPGNGIVVWPGSWISHAHRWPAGRRHQARSESGHGPVLVTNPAAESVACMLRVFIDGLVKRYRQVAAVDGATLDLRPGELTCLLGPQGAGKTTLGRIIAGLETADEGEIYFDERLVHALPPHERRVGMIFPDFALWPGLTVVDNVSYPLKIQGVNKAERRRRSGEVLSRLRIDSLAGKRPEQLSRLQSLRVALARAIVTEPELLILDEPLEPFDARGREEAWDEIHRLRGELGHHDAAA